MQVKIVRVDKTLPLPEYQTRGSVAFDVYTRVDEVFEPGDLKLLPANLIIEVPEGYALILAARSSLARKLGLRLANGIGVIDQDYSGPNDELGLLLHNFTSRRAAVKRGDRLAQGLIIPIERVSWMEADKLKDESRGGWGSTN